MWSGTTDSELREHFAATHWQHWQGMALPLVEEGAYDIFGLYCAAIAWKERSEIPTVGCSVDRRAHVAFSRRHSSEALRTLMCFSCAQLHVHDQCEVERADREKSCVPNIRWHKVWSEERFCGMSRDETQGAIGMTTYLTEYGDGAGGAPCLRSVRAQQELEHWQLRVPFSVGGAVHILCCPEDRRCDKCKPKPFVSGDVPVLCAECELPLCVDCWRALCQKKTRPAMALANDLWTGVDAPTICPLPDCFFGIIVADSPIVLRSRQFSHQVGLC